mgnify:FL=1
MVRNQSIISPDTKLHLIQPLKLSSEKIQTKLPKDAVNNTPQTSEVFSREELEKAVDGLNKTVEVFDRELQFSIHEDTNRIIVRVIKRSQDKEEVIREIPPERILDMIASFMDMIGLLIDQRA